MATISWDVVCRTIKLRGTSTTDEVGELDYGTEVLSWHMFELGVVSGSDPRGIGIMEGSKAVVPSSSRILLDQTRHDSLFY